MPWKQRFNRWKIRVWRHVDCVMGAVLFTVAMPVILVLVLLQCLGFKIFDENDAVECCSCDDENHFPPVEACA